jgi:ribonuclease I
MFGYLSELYHTYINKPENFYYLSLIKEADGFYSIHGLWPQYSLNSYPTFCRPVNFSLDKLKPIMDKLDKYWKSDRCDNKQFWKHEYEKHGSCMFYPLDEFEYFNKTIKLYEYALVNNIIKKLSDKNSNPAKLLIPLDAHFKFI